MARMVRICSDIIPKKGGEGSKNFLAGSHGAGIGTCGGGREEVKHQGFAFEGL